MTKRMALKSPAVAAGVIRPQFPCGGGSLWLPLKWSAPPPETKELAIYIGRFKYVRANGSRRLVVPFADLVSHVNRNARHLATNTLPKGSSYSAFGPVSCPNVRQGQNILLEIFALDRIQVPRMMRSRLATRLTEEALGKNRPQRERSPGKLTEDTAAVGHVIATYGVPKP